MADIDKQIPEWSAILREWWERASREKREQLVQDLGVTNQTIYRWRLGENDPDSKYKLLTLEKHIPEISAALRRQYASMFATSQDLILRMVAPIYAQVLKVLQKTTADMIMQTVCGIVLYALVQHLDVEQLGIVVLLGELRSSNNDGIADHLLVNGWSGYGTGPWVEYQTNGSYSAGEGVLSAEAVTSRRAVFYSREHHPALLTNTALCHLEAVESAAAYPILRSGDVAGVLYIASTQPNYFVSHRREIIEQYALMIPLAFHDSDFYPPARIALRSEDELQMVARLVREAQQGNLSDAEVARRVRQFRQFS